MRLIARRHYGFTLIEVLLAVVVIITLFLIIFWALNPAKQLANTRNAQRSSDADTILKALYQYSIDYNGNFPEDITEEEKEICQTNNYFCNDGVDLSVLTYKNIYLHEIPVDPKVKNLDKTGYTIRKEYDRIVVRAINAENGKEIEITK
ncbi:MAG TPA: type II secretion system protein [bacterium]|nr:type II secretion system protein [bacterium]